MAALPIRQNRANAEYVVIGADHPDRAIGFQHAAHGQQPGAGEIIIGAKRIELVPMIITGIHLGLIRA